MIARLDAISKSPSPPATGERARGRGGVCPCNQLPLTPTLSPLSRGEGAFLRWRLVTSLAIAVAFGFTPLAAAQAPEQKLLREIYQELVEIDTSDASGDTTRAAEAMAARLRAGGIPAADIQVIVPPGGPKKGNLVARLRGSGAKKPLLLLAHIDVVNAKREDWQRDPFKLIEENGYFYARGSSDNKAMAAALVAIMIQLKQQNVRLNRDLILALTADEEIIPSPFSGIEYLIKNHRNLIDAEFALNEGGSGLLDKSGKPLYHGVQAGEKVFQTYRLEVTNAGGHSARPSKDNAIYHLAAGLARLATYDFPFKLLPVTRAYFERAADFESAQLAADMKAILREPPDAPALARLSDTPRFNALLRTTCVATMLDAGHATNALPQRARRRQLPRAAGRIGRRSAEDPGARVRQRQDFDHARRRSGAEPAAAADAGDHAPRQRNFRRHVAGCAGDSDHVGGRHRRPLSQQHRHPDLRHHRQIQ